jgi:hypothetical protein
MRREQTIEHAMNFRDYELSLAELQYDQEISLLEEEYHVKSETNVSQR